MDLKQKSEAEILSVVNPIMDNPMGPRQQFTMKDTSGTSPTVSSWWVVSCSGLSFDHDNRILQQKPPPSQLMLLGGAYTRFNFNSN